jgi:hypothetical protein
MAVLRVEGKAFGGHGGAFPRRKTAGVWEATHGFAPLGNGLMTLHHAPPVFDLTILPASLLV